MDDGGGQAVRVGLSVGRRHLVGIRSAALGPCPSATGYRSAVRRRLLTIAIFLLAGAVLNVAVAWGVARWSRSLEMTMRLQFIDQEASFESTSTPSAWRLDNVPESWPDKPKFEVTARTRWFMFTSQISRWDDKFSTVNLLELRIGVPTKSLACYRLGNNEFGRTWPYPWRHAWGRDYPLPLRPIWPAFAINTLFYATILWLLLPGPFALRRLIRQRRGLCPACGYDLRHGPEACPECGVTG